MSIPEIHRTREYNRFKILDFNRDIDLNHLYHLKELIRKENLLKFHPIVINDSFEVIDGQHRLMAARDLALDIYYIQGDVSYNHVLNTNVLQMNTSLKDVIKFYSKRGNVDYIDLERSVKDLGVSPRAVIALLGVNFDGGYSGDGMHAGNFKYPKDREFLREVFYNYLRLKEIVKKYKVRPAGVVDSAGCCGAFHALSKQDINMDRLLEKIEDRWFDIKPQGKKSKWFDSFITMYNWKTRENRIEITFSDILKLQQKNKSLEKPREQRK